MDVMLRATIYFLTAEQGGRRLGLIPKADMEYSFWANTAQFPDGNVYSVGLYFEPRTIVFPGTIHTVGVDFLVEEAYSLFESGKEFIICEGKRVIAMGNIL